MKKETINVFQEGVNKDLNPLVTPNNTLTDALNATTLTYNGDELSLQTDAGNTKIKVPGKDEYVKLSNGFYPLGLKEYGGVLYIVSGKSIENNYKPLTENTDYSEYDVILFKDWYYYCNEDTHIEEIPETLDSKWTKLANDLEKSKKLFDYIEIGSYPAPEFSDDRMFHGNTTLFSTSTLNKSSFYKTYVINNTFFKSGRRIQFKVNSELIPTNISNVTIDSNPKFYTVKLLHQLDNGILDLTEDIWKQFIKHKNETGDSSIHWLVSPTFFYYCPTRFKGKLLLQVIFDEPKYFRFKTNPQIDFINNEDIENGIDSSKYSHKITFDLEWENSSNISIRDYNIKITNLQNLQISDETEYENITTNEKTIYINYKDDEIGEIFSGLKYVITPTFVYNNEVLTAEELPEEFINKYIISGTRLLEEKYNEIFFTLEDSICAGDDTRDYNVMVLSNRNGYLDLNLELTDEPYVFIKEGIFINDEDRKYILGIYRMENDRAKVYDVASTPEDYRDYVDTNKDMINLITPGLYQHLISQVNATPVRFYDTTCSEVEIIFRLSAALPWSSVSSIGKFGNRQMELIFSQTEVGKDNIVYKVNDWGNINSLHNELKLNVNTLIDLDIKFNGGGMFVDSNCMIPKEALSENKIFQFGLIYTGFTNNIYNVPRINGRADVAGFSEETSRFWGPEITNDNLTRLINDTSSGTNTIVLSFPNNAERTGIVRAEERLSNNYTKLYVDITPGVNSKDNNTFFQKEIPYNIVSGFDFPLDKYINIDNPELYKEFSTSEGESVLFNKHGMFFGSVTPSN